MAVYDGAEQAAGLTPLIRALQAHPSSRATTVSTGGRTPAPDAGGQGPALHPDHDLGLVEAHRDRNELTAGILSRFGALLESAAPDAVLVQGSTTAISAVALAAFSRRVPVLRLEAPGPGPQPCSPFPREADRAVLDRVASVHLVTSSRGRVRLERQGVPATRILSAAAHPWPPPDRDRSPGPGQGPEDQ